MLRRLAVVLVAVALLIGVSTGWVLFREGDGATLPSPALRPWNVAKTPVGVKSVGPVAAGFQSVDRLFWFGDRVAIWGISGTPGDDNVLGYRGASLDPGTGRWTTWPRWPFPDPLYAASTVWTGHDFVVVGTACGGAPRSDEHDEGEYIPACSPGTLVAAAFDPVAARWHALPAPPAARDTGPATVGWTGTLAVFAFGLSPDQQLLGLDPSTRVWSPVPDSPEPSGLKRLCQLDDGVLAVGDLNGTGPLTVQSSILLNDTWRPLPLLTTPATFTGVSTICGGAHVIAVFGDWTHAWQWDRTANDWTEVTGAAPELTSVFAPTPPPAPLISIGWTGSRFVWSTVASNPNSPLQPRTGGALIFDPTNSTWNTAVPGPDELPLLQLGGGLNFINWRHGVKIAIAYPKTRTAQLRLVAYRPV